MSKDKRSGWLAAIKPGDKVFCRGGGRLGRDLAVVKIDSVTPAGRMRVGRVEFDEHGRERAKRSAWSLLAYLIETTKTVRDEWADICLRNRIEVWMRDNFKTASLATLRTVAEAMKATADEGAGREA